MPRKSELERALAAFPFNKLKPTSFAVEIANLVAAVSRRELQERPVRIWVELDDVSKVLKIADFARLIRVYPHLGFAYLETFASELSAIVGSDLVRSVWNDEPVGAPGCVVTRAHPSAFSLAHGIHRRTR